MGYLEIAAMGFLLAALVWGLCAPDTDRRRRPASRGRR